MIPVRFNRSWRRALWFASMLSIPAALAERELCDGRDNDQDGTFDEGCFSSCVDPQSAGAESLISSANTNALNGIDRFAVWDGKRLATVWARHPASADQTIYMRRTDMAGRPLAQELPIYTGPAEKDPAIAWSGDGYGIVWSDEDFALPRVLFAFVNDAGQIAVGPTQVNTVDQDGSRPSIAWNGSEFIVAWSWYNSRLHARRITSAGALLGSEVCLNCSAASGTGELSIAVAQSDLVGYAFADLHGGVSFLQTRKNLTPIGSQLSLTSATGADQPTLVWDGGAWGVAWFDRRLSNAGVYFNRLSTTPSKLLPTDLRVNASERYSSQPSLAWTGSEYLLAWIGGEAPPFVAMLRRIDAAGAAQGAARTYPAGSFPNSHTTLVWTGSRPILVRDEDEFADKSPITARLLNCCVDDDGDGVGWCNGDSDDRDPTVFPSAPELCDGRDNNGNGQLDEAGCDRICESAPFAIDPPLSLQAGAEPALALRGSVSFVTHVDSSKPGVQLTIDRGGPPWIPSAIESDPAVSDEPAGAWCGDSALTVFRDQREGTPRLRVSAVDAVGAPLVSDEPLAVAAAGTGSPLIAWSGRRALLLYRRGSPATLQYSLLAPNGARLLDDPRLDLGLGSDQVAFDLAADPRGGFVAIWLDRTSAGESRVMAVRIDQEGSLLSAPLELAPPAAQRDLALIAGSSSGFLAIWSGLSSGSYAIQGRALDAALQPSGSLLTLSGAPLSNRSRLVWTGAEILAINPSGSSGFATRTRFSESGALLGSSIELGTTTAVTRPAARWDGSGIRTVWSHAASGSTRQVSSGRIDCARTELGLVQRLIASAVHSGPTVTAIRLVWNAAEGTGVGYDVASGALGAGFDLCEANDLAGTTLDLPPRSGNRSYLVRVNGGSYDDNSAGRVGPRSVSACP